MKVMVKIILDLQRDKQMMDVFRLDELLLTCTEAPQEVH